MPNRDRRKNWLFSVCESSAKANAICLKVAETAKTTNGIDYYQYLEEFFNQKELEFSATKLHTLSSEAMGRRTWDGYFERVNSYIKDRQLSLSDDPMTNLLTQQHQLDILNRIKDDYKFKTVKCDKYDYIIALFCGIVTGLIDTFLVGAPSSSILGEWADGQFDNVVTKFAKTVFRFDNANGTNVRTEPRGIASAIGYLERRSK